MKFSRNKIRTAFTFFILATVFIACTKMDDTYKEFLEGGMKVYIGKVDTVFVYPGKNRIQLAWLPPSDPKATKARVYWNNRQDSVNIPMSAMERDTIKVTFDEMTEGNYVFEIFTYDDADNSSLKVEVLAEVYGDEYQRTLLGRPVDTYEMIENTLKINWGALPASTVYGSEVAFKDEEGVAQTLFVSGDEDVTFIENFTPQTVKYRTLYIPAPLAIDTFFTTYSSFRIKGEPVELSKAGWTATASSYDIAGNRPPSNAIDEDPTTIWVNQTKNPAFAYPHTITVDMGAIEESVDGFAIITRVGDASARPRTIELFTSMDGVNWNEHGATVLENSGDKQIIAFEDALDARYFKMTAKDSFKGNNIALAEIGMYRY